MQNEIRTWLADIQQAIEEINLFLPDQKNFLKLQRDLEKQINKLLNGNK